MGGPAWAPYGPAAYAPGTGVGWPGTAGGNAGGGTGGGPPG